jgi:hypothetical protein
MIYLGWYQLLMGTKRLERKSRLSCPPVEKATEQKLIALMEMNRAALSAIEAVKQEMEATSASNAGVRMAVTLKALQQLARYLSPIPGRKNVIWIAGSFPVNIFPASNILREFQGDI